MTVISNMDETRVAIKIKPEIVEIKKEDIDGPDTSHNEPKGVSNFISTVSSSSCNIYNTQEVKSEPEFNEENYNKYGTRSEDNPCVVRESSISPTNNHSNHILRIKTEPEFTQPIETNHTEIKEEDDSSDESDHFIETHMKSEKLTEYDSKKRDNEIEDAFFNQEFKEAYIKDDIEVEEHQIKFEINESSAGNTHEHGETKKTKTRFSCNLCNYETSSQSSFKKHSSLHEDPSKGLLYFCTKCSYRTRQRCHLRRHDLVHQNSAEIMKFSCAICNFKTKQKCTLKRHIISVHVNKDRTYSIKNNTVENEVLRCSECSYTTYKKGLLLSHMDKHKDTGDVTNLYICDICSFSTKYRRNLRVHLETHRESQELQIYECKLCNFKTRMGYCLKRHFLSRKHLLAADKIEEYCPRTQKL